MHFRFVVAYGALNLDFCFRDLCFDDAVNWVFENMVRAIDESFAPPYEHFKGWQARGPLYTLLLDHEATYSFWNAEDVPQKKVNAALFPPWKAKHKRWVFVAFITGMHPSTNSVHSHQGGLVRHKAEMAVIETKAWVLLYRPNPEKFSFIDG